MTDSLRALVIGAGNAGRGQVDALRFADVEVVGLASRSRGAATRVAGELQIARASDDWRSLLDELRPDIVGVATPGDTHFEIVEAALSRACHVFCERPVAPTAEQARQLYELSRERAVKTAYCTPAIFQPQAIFVRELLRQGEIGTVREIECVSHFQWPRLTPFSWQHQLAAGGGRLNHLFPQTLALAEFLTGGVVLAATGECRKDLPRVPSGGSEALVRHWARHPPTEVELSRLKWSAVDVDSSYSAVVRLGTRTAPHGELTGETITGTFRHAAYHPAWHPDHIAFFGDKGTLHVMGSTMQGTVLSYTGGRTWEERGIPFEIHDALPLEVSDDRRNWMAMMAQFVADIRQDQEFAPYPTFREGWLYQQVIEIVRSGRGWQDVVRDGP